MLNALLVDAVPWGAVDHNWIKQVVEGGEALQADSRVPEPFYPLICVGLQPHATERTQSVQDLCVTLRSDIKVCDQTQRVQDLCFTLRSDIRVCYQTQSMQDICVTLKSDIKLGFPTACLWFSGKTHSGSLVKANFISK